MNRKISNKDERLDAVLQHLRQEPTRISVDDIEHRLRGDVTLQAESHARRD